MGESPITLANELMTIDEACIEVGMGSVSGLAKTYCPFGDIFHEDGGRSRAFKIYPESNSAYCFACKRRFDPVSLIATEREISYRAAAAWILEFKEYVPPDFQSRWDALAKATEKIDHEALKDALKIACARMVPDWETRQFEDRVAKKLTVCFSVVRKVATAEESRQWLDVAKQAMAQALGVAKRPTSG